MTQVLFIVLTVYIYLALGKTIIIFYILHVYIWHKVFVFFFRSGRVVCIIFFASCDLEIMYQYWPVEATDMLSMYPCCINGRLIYVL